MIMHRCAEGLACHVQSWCFFDVCFCENKRIGPPNSPKNAGIDRLQLALGCPLSNTVILAVQID